MSAGDEMPLEETGDRIDVTEMHEPIIREHDEPEDGFEPVPSWMLAVFGVVLFWGGYYLARHNGDWAGDRLDAMDADPVAGVGVLAPDTPEKLAVVGRGVYRAQCARCHQEDGRGTPGAVPPLAGSEWVVGPDTARLVGIVLNGLKGPIKVGGIDFDGECPAFGPVLRDDAVAAVVTSIRSEWGNKAEAVYPDAVKAHRR